MHLWNSALIDWLKRRAERQNFGLRMNIELKTLCSSFIRMCQRDSDGKRHRSGCYFHLHLPNCKRKVNSVCHTEPRPRAVMNSDHHIPHETGTALVPTNFCHCGNYFITFGKDIAKTASWANYKAVRPGSSRRSTKPFQLRGLHAYSQAGTPGGAQLPHADMPLHPKEQPWPSMGWAVLQAPETRIPKASRLLWRGRWEIHPCLNQVSEVELYVYPQQMSKERSGEIW